MTSTQSSFTPLAMGFPPATPEGWKVLAEKTLKGATVESLATTTEGVTIQPLYTAANAGDPPAIPQRASRGDGRAWDLRAPIGGGDVALAHEGILSALAEGAASILIDIAALGVSDAAAMEALLDGVLTDVAPVALEGAAAASAEALSAAVKASPSAPLVFHLDPLSAMARGGEGADEAIGECAAAGSRLATVHPKASLFLASGALIHEAGGEPALELAFALASAVAYARALVDAGMAMEDAFARIVLGLAADNRPLAAVAKLRAARLLWGQLTQACGAPTPARIEARSSRRMLTIADPWSNLVRLTQAGFAAAVGGADAVVLYPHDAAAAGASDALGARLARNAGLILMEEAHLGAVADPTAGAWAFEALTTDLARAAWARFQEIERAGGAAAAIRSGLIAEAVETSSSDLSLSLHERRRRIVGVTDFRAEIAATAAAPSQGGALAPIRLEALVS